MAYAPLLLKHCSSLICFAGLLTSPSLASADLVETIEKIKPSIVVVGSYKKTSSPAFTLRGTGFVVGNGNLVATNAHVVAEQTDPDGPILVIQARATNGDIQLRRAQKIASDKDHDLAILRVEGSPLPPFHLADNYRVREGQAVAFTGFPIGGVLGFSPVTHRGIVSAITPIAIPGGNAQQLNEKLIQRLKSGTFDILQLDATAYPGNSGSPVFDPETGDVLGIINMVFIKGSKEAILSQPSGITYAIPVRYLIDALRQF